MKCVKNKKQNQNIVLTFVVPHPECQYLGSTISYVDCIVLIMMHRGALTGLLVPIFNGLGLTSADILLPGFSGVEIEVRKINVPREERELGILHRIYIYLNIYIYLKNLVLKYFYHVCMYM